MEGGGSGIVGRVAEREHGAHANGFGQGECPGDGIGGEGADPAGADPLLPRLEHHMRCDDGGIGLARAVSRHTAVLPIAVGIIPDDEDHGCIKGIAADLGKPLALLCALYHIDPLGLIVAGGRRYAPCLEDRRELLGVLMSTESAQLEQINAKMDANNTLLEKMRADYEQIIAMSERYEEDLAVLQADERSAANVVKEITALRQKKDEQRLDLEDHVADLNDRMTAVIIKISETAKDTETEHTLLGVCRTRVDMYAEEIRASRERIISLEDMIEGYTVFQADNRQKYAAGQEKLQELNSKRAGIENDSMDFEKKLNEMNARMREKMSQKEIIFREYTKCENKLANLRDELDKLSSKLWDDYEMTRADAIALGYPAITPENRREMVALQTECRNKLRAIGHVDLGAVEKYQDVKKRYDEMNEQITDLEKSRAETLKIIAELEAEMKAVFVESFNQINENFGRVFAELFGGGSAELSLSDPENILESGIEIKAAPPGKIIKNLMQLSGGEQAFIGVALFFAILKVNPTPFCILDEIEAALDEVNVERLAQYIKKYTDGTQFIMITHRRGTMAAATRLYGVTMPEHGISKVLTLDVNDIEKQKESNWDGIFG